MISIISAAYDHLLSCIIVLWSVSKCPTGSVCTPEYSTSNTGSKKPDEVYFRFSGGALAEMFHTRYKQMKSSKQHTVKAKISEELSLLKCMQMEDKEKHILPDSLKYRDCGHMYFPHENLLPFIRKVEEVVRMRANADTFKNEGSNMIKVCV